MSYIIQFILCTLRIISEKENRNHVKVEEILKEALIKYIGADHIDHTSKMYSPDCKLILIKR